MQGQNNPFISKAEGSAKTETTAIQTYYPPNRGFLDSPTTETLKPGTMIDRYGFEGGTFVSPVGTPYEMRALAPDSLSKPYNVYEVVKPAEVSSGKVAPWFGQPGKGTQYEFSKTI